MKSSWMGMGFSHHRVPSLSKTATRSSGGTASLPPGEVTDSTKARMACLLAPSRQLGSGSRGSAETSRSAAGLDVVMASLPCG
jgi:hypothetical protein